MNGDDGHRDSQGDDQRDEIVREYRRASAADAGRPADTTRAAILAQARRAAAQRRGGAGATRTWWRAAASVAVLGVAVLAWRELGGPAVTPTTLPESSELRASRAELDAAVDSVGRESANEAAPAAAPQPVAPQPVAAPPPIAERAPPRPAMVAASPPPPPAAPPVESFARDRAQAEQSARKSAAADNSQALQEVVPVAPAARAFGQAAGAQRAENAPRADVQLLQSRFAAEYESERPPAVAWVLEDAAGTVLRTGTLDSTDDLARVRQDLQRAYPDSTIDVWTLRTVTNARGATLTLGTARATPRQP